MAIDNSPETTDVMTKPHGYFALAIALIPIMLIVATAVIDPYYINDETIKSLLLYCSSAIFLLIVIDANYLARRKVHIGRTFLIGAFFYPYYLFIRSRRLDERQILSVLIMAFLGFILAAPYFVDPTESYIGEGLPRCDDPFSIRQVAEIAEDIPGNGTKFPVLAIHSIDEAYSDSEIRKCSGVARTVQQQESPITYTIEYNSASGGFWYYVTLGSQDDQSPEQ
ncbi:MAG: hypothetical protein KF874_07095 [Rhizobiaceae bacterium]|nr:hypothetical protein [Rhizobiaceae bacterium]